ncbi:MAG: hypothetical protein JWQ48_531 [Conexibacter sp.]|nr:hypothetical protein [Conexibacter sp.]
MVANVAFEAERAGGVGLVNTSFERRGVVEFLEGDRFARRGIEENHAAVLVANAGLLCRAPQVLGRVRELGCALTSSSRLVGAAQVLDDREAGGAGLALGGGDRLLPCADAPDLALDVRGEDVPDQRVVANAIDRVHGSFGASAPVALGFDILVADWVG